MKKIPAILSLAVLFSCSGGEKKSDAIDAAKDKASEMTNGASSAPVAESNPGFKKYDIKSGIITFEEKKEMMGTVIKTKSVVYFDDNGVKECTETFKTDAAGKETLTDRNFVKDGYHYICSIENKGGIKMKAMGSGVEAQFNMEEASTLKDSKFKKTEDETVCGKTCTGFTMHTPSGNIKMCGWNHITLKTTLDNPEMKMKSEKIATKIEENAAIPADKFEVPKDCVMKEM